MTTISDKRSESRSLPQWNRPYTWDAAEDRIKDCHGFTLDPDEIVLLLNGQTTDSAASEIGLRERLISLVPSECKGDRASLTSECATCRIYAVLKEAPK